jgi:hypothetical protein
MTIEAAPQPSNFTATFEIKPTGIRTGTVGELTQVIKKVEWTLKGTEQGQSFELPQTTDMGEPDSANFIPLSQVTEESVIAWIEATETRLPSIKAHIQYVLDKEVAKASLEATPMPWAPVAEPTPAQPE